MLRFCFKCHGLDYVPLWNKPEDLATWQRVLTDAVMEAPSHPSWEEYWDDYIMGLKDGNILGAFKAATEALGIEVGQEAW